MDPEKQLFFSRMAEQGLALTFDDVRLQTGPSRDKELPSISLESRFSRNVALKTPFVSAAMDTVTTSEMAIAMAKLGGIGVIHAGLTIEEQKHEVRRVKRHLNGRIDDPVTVHADRSLESILKECDERKLDFRTFPVVDSDNKLVGLLTQNDIDFCDNLSELIGGIMTPASEVRSAGETTTINEAHVLMKRHKKKTIPLVKPDGTIGGLYVLSDVKRIVLGNSGQYSVDASGRLLVAAAVPTNNEALDRVRAMRRYLDVVVVDTADGDSYYAFKILESLKAEFPEIDVVIGNISDGHSASELGHAGADGIKVGQGGGSICSTRDETGIGMPQVTAVYECAKAVEDKGIPVCSDGGIRSRGDISIAIASGAHSVMMGKMLAGTKETPGELITLENGSRVKRYRGMGSASALKDSAASRMRYGESENSDPLPEGVESLEPYKGSVAEVLDLCVKALRKSLRYVKAPDIESHRLNTRLRRITNAGLRESHPHDVNIISR